eukprot:CAMPEP_0196156192 /NCGR_PEP_ID=MMETSP0910-20130528/41930_1 /TAXON_ID=49265 /ORGANISM="Thalassiosira rotula, Strain GSO102" /LENGTH=78 /DNA_ID=CAMNT_0041420579 /DNA_START=96 /DNA_END=329 /DNA_ORIENTATION=+
MVKHLGIENNNNDRIKTELLHWGFRECKRADVGSYFHVHFLRGYFDRVAKLVECDEEVVEDGRPKNDNDNINSINDND